MQTHIGLLDCNNFFVSCERLFRPDIWHRPVVVLSSNDGCIIARSQEVKDKGVPMGVPYFQVKDILSDMQTVVFSSHLALYRDISRRIFNLVRSQVDVFEQYSVDEGFFLVRGDYPQTEAESLKAYVEQRVGVPVSIGIATTKTQAKYANAQTKRQSGAWYMSAAVFQEQAATVPLGELWGVGASRSRAFTQHGLRTVSDLCAADAARIDRLFGVEGIRLRGELLGHMAYRVTSQQVPQQSVMSSRSFRAPSNNRTVLHDALAYHVRHAVADLRAQGQVAGAIRISLQPSRHGVYALRGGVCSTELPQASNDTFAILRVATQALTSLWESGVPYQKVGILLYDLVSTAVTQERLFVDATTTERPQLLRAVDTLNQRYGLDTVRVGSALVEAKWHARRDRLSPAYTTRWSDIPIVSAGR